MRTITTEVENQRCTLVAASDDQARSKPHHALGAFNLVAFAALSLVGTVALSLINQGEEIVAGGVTWAVAVQGGVIFVSLFGASVYFARESH